MLTAEYNVCCSFIEICFEKVWDLLNPVNCSVQFLSDDNVDHQGAVDNAGNKGRSSTSSSSNSDNNGGARLEGISEACCFDKSNVASLLVRGNAPSRRRIQGHVQPDPAQDD